jgi:hypothetical protein
MGVCYDYEMNILTEYIYHRINNILTIRLKEAFNKIHAYVIKMSLWNGKGLQ